MGRKARGAPRFMDRRVVPVTIAGSGVRIPVDNLAPDA